MLKTFVACARNSIIRDSFMGMTLVNAISNTLLPGPMMLLRRASPNCPVCGVVNAAVLNHSRIEGSDRLTFCPGTTSGRSVPFDPVVRAALEKFAASKDGLPT